MSAERMRKIFSPNVPLMNLPESTVNKLLLGLAVMVLCGCEQLQSPQPDQLLRHQYFMECLKALPAGPQSTKYNDWDDVVDSCASAAYYQSLQLDKQPFKPEGEQ